MVRSELLQKICNHHPYILRKDVEKILEIIFFEIEEALCRGENVEIRGFGTYKLIKRKARIVEIPEKNAIKWKMSKIFFGRLNKNFTQNKISDTH